MSLKANKAAIALGTAFAATLSVPAMVFAFPQAFPEMPVSVDAPGTIGSFTPASVDSRLLGNIKLDKLSGKNKFRFTPAASSDDSANKRALTIAVRVRPEVAQAITVKKSMDSDSKGRRSLDSLMSASVNLGTAKGFQKFALDTTKTTIADQKLGKGLVPLPDMAILDDKSDKQEKSRFRPHVDLGLNEGNGRDPKVRDSRTDQGSYAVDVGGSYKITNNLDVTAGIRIQSERDRLDRLTNEQYDSQAVYIGTEFRF